MSLGGGTPGDPLARDIGQTPPAAAAAAGEREPGWELLGMTGLGHQLLDVGEGLSEILFSTENGPQVTIVLLSPAPRACISCNYWRGISRNG